MPHISGTITPWGPLINVMISLSQPRLQALQQLGMPVPPPKVAKLVVDTGASMTAIDEAILTALNLTPTGTQSIHTPSTQGTPHQVNLYDVGIIIFGFPNMPPALVVGAHPVIDGNYKAQGIDGLLGRDILSMGRVIYGGPDSYFMISF